MPQPFILRPLRVDDDLEGIYAVMVDSVQADQIDPYSTLEGVEPIDAVALALSVHDPSLFCVAERDGQIVGYNHIIRWKEDDNVWLYLPLGRVTPAFRGQGIGTALLQWSEARIRQVATLDSHDKAIYGANASSTELESTKLLLDHGYEVVFTVAEMHFDTFESLPVVYLPADMVLRSPTPDDALAMHLSFQAAWSKGIFGVAVGQDDETETARLRDEIAQDGALWRVVMVGDVVAGQIWCSLHKKDGVQWGVVDEINVHPDFRRRGVAQALMIDALARFQAEGATFVRLHTDDGNRNGAKSLYEKIGFRRLKTFPRYRKSL